VAGLTSVDDALALVLDHARPLSAETVPLRGAAGRVLVEDARAAIDLPSFPSSAMDGFAVRTCDCPGTLPVELRIPAGRPAPRALAPGEAMGIATGAVVPDGADAVVPLELVTDHENRIDVPQAPAQGANVREVGGDVRRGDVVVAAGTRLGAAQVAALAASGADRVDCARLPTVAVLATGTELRRAGESLRPGQIYESNGVMLAAELARAGALVDDPVVVPDDPGAHRKALERAFARDVLVTTGGVSVGPHDLVRRAATELGAEEVFWGVAVRPGKPLSFAVRGKTLVFGLPGNPVSSLVGAVLFVRPALLALQGAAAPGPVYREAVLDSALRRSAQREDFVRARWRPSGDERLVPLPGQESHMITQAAAADVLVRVPRGEGELAAGSRVRYLEL
jgi:molybdopterin molybdotransferase